VHKLSFKYFGPYLVLQRVGPVAYKLQLPTDSKIHPVFHVSQLKKALPPYVQPLPDAQLTILEEETTTTPYQVLHTGFRKVGNAAVLYACVQWGSPPTTWTSWENMHNLPLMTTSASLLTEDAAALGHTATQAGRDVMTAHHWALSPFMLYILGRKSGCAPLACIGLDP